MKGETEKREGTRAETPARIPYIGKPAKKLKCWRPKRRGVRGAPACQFNPLHDSLMRDPFAVHVANSLSLDIISKDNFREKGKFRVKVVDWESDADERNQDSVRRTNRS